MRPNKRARVESLEARRLLSVSAASFAYPLTPGLAWTDSDDSGTTESLTVIGPTTFNSRAVTKIVDVSTLTDGQVDNSTQYIAYDPAGNLALFGLHSVSTDTSADPAVTTTTDQTFTPGKILFPVNMVAGTVYSFSTVDHGVQSKSDGSGTTSDITYNYTLKLPSEMRQSVTVPAGTFLCYELDQTLSFTISGKTNTSSDSYWIMPGLPPVKTINNVGVNQSTSVLTSFNGKQTPTKLAFDVQPSPVNTATKMTPSVMVEVENADGTLDTTDTSSVTLEVNTGPVGGSTGGTVTVAAVGGIATFSNLTLNIAGTYTLKATDGALTQAISNSFNVTTKASASKLAFAVQPATTVAGRNIAPSVTVNVEYPGGAIVVTDNSTVTLSLASGPGTLGGTLTAKAVNGVATFSSLLLTKVGAHTLKAVDAALTAATSASFNIIPAAATKLVLAKPPAASTVAGKAIAPAVVVDIDDQFGNIVTSNVSTVAMAIASGGGKLGGTASVVAKAGVATFSNLLISKVGTYTIKATDGALAAVTSGAFKIVAAAAAKLVISKQPTTGIAGSNFAPALSVLVEDAFGNVVTSNASAVTVALATKPTGGALIGTLAAAAVKGVATFGPLALKIAGAYTLKATDGVLTAAVSKAITITAAVASKLVDSKQPTAGVAGVKLSPATVLVEDAYGNVVTTNNSAVTLALTTKPKGGAIGGTLTATAVKGVATFSTLSIKIAGGYAFKATDGVLAAAASKVITISPAAAAKLVISKQPTTGVAGVALSPTTVMVEDAFGNVVTSNSSAVTLAPATAPAGAPIAGPAIANAVKGVATFSAGAPQTAGSYSFMVSDGALASAVTKPIVVAPAAASKLVFAQQPTTGKAGVALTPVLDVNVTDAFGNIVSGDASTVALALTAAPAGGKFIGAFSAQAVGGVAKFVGLSLSTIGIYTIKATDGLLAPAITNPISVS